MKLRTRTQLLLLSLLLAVGCAGPMRVGLRAWEHGDGARALAEWTPLAEDGDPEARFLVGLAHEEGRGTTPDPAEAARWYRLAAEAGHAGAQNNLGLLYFRGAGVERSAETAAAWYRSAAAQGFAPARNNLAVLELLGAGTERDAADAQELLATSRRGGDPRAARLEALLEESGGLEEHLASQDLRLRADDGDATAQYQLALTHLHGDTPDPAVAAAWFERAADGGHAKAATCFARMLLEGEVVARDDARAAGYLRVAADAGLAQAQHDLALLHLRGRGVERDDRVACELLARAARQDHRASIAKLGVLEHGVRQDRLAEIRAGQGISIPVEPRPAQEPAHPSTVARVDDRR